MAQAGSVTFTDQNPFRGPLRPVRKCILQWTSSAGGAVSGNPVGPVSGTIERVVFIPGAGGVQPSNNYVAKLQLLNGDGFDDGLDLLANQGAALSNATNSTIIPGAEVTDGTRTTAAPVAVNDLLDLVISGAGNAKQGTVVLYVR